jgi:histone deacetylase 1/2
LRPYNQRKLSFRSIQCVFLGYSQFHKGFKCLEPKSGRVYISRDVIFDETVFPFETMHPNARVLTDKRRIPLRSASVRTPHLFHHGIPKVLVNPRSKGITSVRSTFTL